MRRARPLVLLACIGAAVLSPAPLAGRAPGSPGRAAALAVQTDGGASVPGLQPSDEAGHGDVFLAQYAATSRFRRGRPTEITVTPDGRSVLFLRSGPRSFVQDLFEHDVVTGREHVVVAADSLLRGAEERLTPEELARRERQRDTGRGVASYRLSRDGRRILLPLSGKLFVLERADGSLREVRSAPGAPIDPQFSPDGDRIACVRNQDLYVIDLASGDERRLTEGGGGSVSYGTAEFVAQEEMGRHEGYWWAPDGRTIACQRTDLGGVERLSIADPAHPERPAQTWPYPRAGGTNAEVTLELVPVDGGRAIPVDWDRARYPYLAAVVWQENAPLTLLVQNRAQSEELLLAVDRQTGATTTILAEGDPAWLNLWTGMPKWLADGRSFLWITEREGAAQLELRGRDGRLLRALTPPEPGLRPGIHLDEARGTVWIRRGDDPTQVQLLRVPLDARRGGRAPVATEPGQHGMVFARTGGAWVHTVTPLAGPPRWEVRRADGRVAGELRSLAEMPLVTPRPEFTTVGDSTRFHAVILRPRDFEPGLRYPVIVSVYGGPHSQTVVASAWNYFVQQWLADQGFIVVSIDGRGTPGRGRDWERATRGDLIGLPLKDQVEALMALGRRHPEMDLARVGITGWSFGGYFTTLALERRPDVFRAGVAGAPVTDWRDYDTHYTERYMGLPDENRAGYEATSALTWAKDLTVPLLILHGTADDNVYFFHSLKLCDALFRAGRSFELVPLRGYTHMVADSVGVTQVHGRIVRHFRRHLGEPR